MNDFTTTTAGVSNSRDGVVKAASPIYRNLSTTHPSTSSRYTSVVNSSRNGLLTACRVDRQQKWRESADYDKLSNSSSFDVAVNGHDYVRWATPPRRPPPPRRHSEGDVDGDTAIRYPDDDGVLDSGKSLTSPMPSSSRESIKADKLDNMTALSAARRIDPQRIHVKPTTTSTSASSSGALVLKKENKSWTVKMKPSTTLSSMGSGIESDATSGQRIKGKRSSDDAKRKAEPTNNNNCVNSKLHRPSDSRQKDCKSSRVSNQKDPAKHHTPVTSQKPICCRYDDDRDIASTSSKADTAMNKDVTLNVNHRVNVSAENGHGLIIKKHCAKVKHSHHSGGKSKKKKSKTKNRDKLSSVDSKLSSLNRHPGPKRNFVDEGRKGEEAAYKALASTNGLEGSSKSVKKAEKEIARALEVIQLQLKVLQNHKKKPAKGSSKLAGKVTKKTTGKLNPKKKPWEPSFSIDLTDVFPLPPSLIVKDGDLHPACSMRADPGCPPGSNHPIWRWRLGNRPLPRPPSCRSNRARENNDKPGTSSSR